MQRQEPPLNDSDILTLDSLLAHIPGPFSPMDASALDGYLCGVLLQPVTISPASWLPCVFDLDGRADATGHAVGLPAVPQAARISALAMRRHAELDRAIGSRQWFDPWIFETDEEASDDEAASRQGGSLPIDEAVSGWTPGAAVAAQQLWVAGFDAAMSRYPALMARDDPATLEPLAVLYAAFDPDDLEDADQLLPLIETLEPPSTLAEAAEDLVRSVLLLADVTRPIARRPSARPRPAAAARSAGSRGRYNRQPKT
jgi:uncharacterized protein